MSLHTWTKRDWTKRHIYHTWRTPFVVYYLNWRLNLKRRVKKKDYEDLSETNVAKVIKLLNPATSLEKDGSENKPITKKEACQLLRIAYSTQRLARIIEEYNDTKDYRKRRKQQLRGTLPTDSEIAEAIQSELRGDPITDTAKRMFRSVGFVRDIIRRVGVPTRGSNELERSTYGVLPDACVSDEFALGDTVWSAKYHSSATVKAVYDAEYCNSKKGLKYVDYNKKYGSQCYSIYVHQRVDNLDSAGAGFYADSLAYDLGKLNHLQEYGVDFERL